MDKSLADYVFAACSNPQRLESHPTTEGKRKLATSLKATMREARRFYVDEDVTRAAAKLGVQHPEILKSMLGRARLPFKTCWVEWDNRAQIDEVGQVLASDAPKRIGALVERLDEHEPLYRLTTVVAHEDDNHVIISPLSILYHLTENIADAPMSHDRQMIRDISGFPDSYINKTLIGSAYVGQVSDGMDQEEIAHRHRLCDDLSKHAVHTLSPFLAPLMREAMSGNPIYNRKEVARGIQNDIIEGSGTWRLILSLFALINSRDYVESEFPDKRIGKRFESGKVVPYLSHHLVKLKLPRKIVETRIVKEMADAIPRRRHEVSGHFKHSRKRWPGDPNCDHAWINETSTREACANCGHRRWWTNDFLRGDARIGFITKDRLVTED